MRSIVLKRFLDWVEINQDSILIILCALFLLYLLFAIGFYRGERLDLITQAIQQGVDIHIHHGWSGVDVDIHHVKPDK